MSEAVPKGPLAETMVHVVIGRLGGCRGDLARALGWSKWSAGAYVRALGYRFREGGA